MVDFTLALDRWRRELGRAELPLAFAAYHFSQYGGGVGFGNAWVAAGSGFVLGLVREDVYGTVLCKALRR